jgi:glycosyltransferase involved in cell wall biosynthesis
MTVLEAMAQKLPVVALPDSGAIPWLLEEGRAGVLAENQSPEALAKAITYLLQDKKRRTDLGEKGYQRALEKFELTGVAMSYLSLLETCAGNHVA